MLFLNGVKAMKKKIILKLSSGILGGVLVLSGVPQFGKVEVHAKEKIEVEVNQDAQVGIIENDKGAILEIKAIKDIKNIDVKITLDGKKTINYHIDKLSAGEIEQKEISKDELEKIKKYRVLPNTAIVRKSLQKSAIVHDTIFKAKVSYDAEGEVEATSSQTENNNESTRQKAKLDFLVLTSANKPISDTLTFKFVNKNHPEEVVEITSKDGMLTSSQLYTNEEYNISIKDNKKYSFDPMDVVLKKEEGYYILYNAKSERIINHLDLKVKKESTTSTSKHLSLDSISAKVLDKNNQVIDSVPFKLSEFNNNTPNIVKESKTSKDGIVTVKSSDLKPNTKYELKIEKNDTTFSRDSLVFTTDDKGRISNLDNKAVTDKTSDVVEFKEEVKNKQKEKIGTISNVLVMSKEQQVIDELEFELVSKSDPKDVIVVKSVKGELSKVPVKMGDKYTLRIKNSKKYTYQQDIEIHDEGGEAIPFLSGTEEPLAKIYLAEK